MGKFSYKNILVIRTDRIGDVILTTPALKALRIAFPGAKITVMVAPLTEALIEDNPYIDDIIVDDRRGEYEGMFGTLSLIGLLRLKKFDLAINYHTKRRTNFLAFMAGIKHRLGYKNNKFGYLLNKSVKDTRHLGERHEVDCCLDLLEAIDVRSQGKELFITVRDAAEEWVGQFLSQNNIDRSLPFVLVHPGASDPNKMWPAKQFGLLIDRLNDEYNAQIILVGAPNIREVSRKIKAFAMHDPIDLTGVTALPQLVSLIKHADLLISNDSGPVHVAAALNKPVISIFTRNQPGINPDRWKPLGEHSKALFPSKGANFAELEESKVVENNEFISVSDVLQEVDAFLKL
ncbi:MAG: lipopolysaccharide heptosyltransferase II [Candidatus Omnitrophota bacterium]|jgi:lipopolysaccharide heptosyltransferase II